VTKLFLCDNFHENASGKISVNTKFCLTLVKELQNLALVVQPREMAWPW